jgi:ornithine carbamoyltransferase
MIGCAKMGADISVAGPKKYQPNKDIVDIAIKSAKNSGSQIIVISDPFEAVKDADIIYTDTFVSMGLETEKEKRLSVFVPKYQVNKRLLESTGKKTYFMHCLPAHRGEEVTVEVIDGKNSIVWDQAENRMHAQKALLTDLLL